MIAIGCEVVPNVKILFPIFLSFESDIASALKITYLTQFMKKFDRETLTENLTKSTENKIISESTMVAGLEWMNQLFAEIRSGNLTRF